MIRIPLLDKFPVDVIVFQKRGRGLSAFRDKARYMDKEGEKYYELKKAGSKFRPSSFDDFVIQNNGNPLIVLYEYQRDMLVPVNTSDLEVNSEGKAINLHAIEEDMSFWGQMRRWKAEERHKEDSWIQRNKDFLMMALVFVFFIMMSYIFMSNISEQSHNIVDAMMKLSESGGSVPG